MQNPIESWDQVSIPPIWSIAHIQSKKNQNNEPTKHEIIISEYIAIRSMMGDITQSWIHHANYISFWVFFFGSWPALWVLDVYTNALDTFVENLPENEFLLGIIIVLCFFGAFGACILLGMGIPSIIHRIFLHPIEHTCSAMLSFHKNQWTKQTYSDTTSAIEDITHQISTIYELYETLYRQSQSRWLRSVSERLRTLLSESSLYMIQEISRLKSELHSQLTMQIDDLESARDQVARLQRPSLTADIQTRLDRQIEQFRLLQQKL